MILLQKQQIRKIIAERKAQQTEASFTIKSEALLTHLESIPIFQKSKNILIYNALKDEVKTLTFIEKWKDKKTIFLPVVDGEYLKIKTYKGNSYLKIGAYGINEPTGKLFTDYEKIDLAIIPGISFDVYGNRLGRGKGYYDRLLPQIKAYKIGICFSFQVFDNIPTEPHDTKMDLVLTEEGILSEK